MQAFYKNGWKRFAGATATMVLLTALTGLACGGLGQAVDVEATIAAGVAATRQAETNLQATIETAVAATQIAGQTAVDYLPEPAAVTPVAPISLPDPEQVRSVILSEANSAIAQDLTLLESLFAPDAVVIDRKGTPDDPDDDTVWQGWANIERRYLAFFSANFSSLNLVDLTVQMDDDQATASHRGVVLDGTLYPDKGIYTLKKIDGHWLITRLEFGNQAGAPSPLADVAERATTEPPRRDDGLYILEIGNQHRYEEPWGWDRGDPCQAWETDNFDDTRPDYRGFNVELLLTNNSDTKVPDAWPISFTTAKGKSVKTCYYGYEGSGPSPGATSSVTFFTVVEKGDYVEKIIFSLADQTVQLCLDGKGGWLKC